MMGVNQIMANGSTSCDHIQLNCKGWAHLAKKSLSVLVKCKLSGVNYIFPKGETGTADMSPLLKTSVLRDNDARRWLIKFWINKSTKLISGLISEWSIFFHSVARSSVCSCEWTEGSLPTDSTDTSRKCGWSMQSINLSCLHSLSPRTTWLKYLHALVDKWTMTLHILYIHNTQQATTCQIHERQ